MIESILKTIPIFSNTSICDFKVEKLAGLTNNNYLLTFVTNNTKYILRVPKETTNPFINRPDEAHNAEVAQQLGIAPKCLWRGEGDQEGMSLCEFIDNAEHPDVKEQSMVDRVATTLAKLHHSPITFDGTLDNKSISSKLTQYFELCSADQQQLLASAYQKSLSLLEAQFDTRPVVPSHVDLITENILQQGDKIWFIDWEYSAMVSPFWDVAIFCNSAGFDAKRSKLFLEKTLNNYQTADFQSLNSFRIITKTISDCWGFALT